MIRRILFFFALFLASSLHAQETVELLSPFARGAGGTYSTSARGLDAMGLNPALLALNPPRPFELQLAPISTFGIDAGPTLVHLASISSGFQDTNLSSTAPASVAGTIGDSTREALVDFMRNNKLSSSLSMRLLGFSYHDPSAGTFAFSWTFHAALRVSVPDSLFEFIGKNAESDLISTVVLSPHQMDVQGIAYDEYNFSYARNIFGRECSREVQLLAGVGLKYVTGIEMLRVDPSSTFAINYIRPTQGGSATVSAKYAIRVAYPDEFAPNGLPSGFSLGYLVSAVAGVGIGADIGFTLGAFDSARSSPWQLSLSVTDIGSIKWDRHTDVRSADTTETAYFATLGQQDTINSKLRPIGGKLDTTDASFTTKLPTTLHIGGALDLAEIGLAIPGFQFAAAMEYALGLTDVVGSPNNGRFGIAAMLAKPGKGFSYHTALGLITQDGITDMTFAFGIGISNSFMLDLGTARLFGLFHTDGNKDAVLGMKILF